jgi:ankyrin repeat protein
MDQNLSNSYNNRENIMKFFLLPMFLLLTTNGYALEIVTCSKDYTGSDVHTAYQLKDLTIKYQAYIPGSSFGALRAKGQIGYAGIRSEVKRIYTENILSYKSVLDENFSLKLNKIKDDKFEGVLTLNKGSTFENKLTDLKCFVRGELPKAKVCAESQEDKDKTLFDSLRTSDLDEIKFVLECGADTNVTDKLGCNPLLKVLDEQCGQLNRMSLSYSAYKQSQMASLLVDSGTNLESVDPSNNQTALHKATLVGNSDLAFMLIELEVNLDAQDKNNMTALMIAVKNNDFFLVKDLVKANANLDLKNSSGKTAFDIAKNLNRVEIAELLIPVKKKITVEGNANNIGCSLSTIELSLNEPVEIVLKAPKRKMFLFESAELEIELMAMSNEEVKTRFTPTRTGNFKFMCGPHGGPINQQTIGTISVR